MKTQLFLVVTKKGGAKAYTRYYPSCEADEVILTFNLDLPDSLFTQPPLIANVRIDPESVTPVQITADLVNQIQQSIEEKGIAVTVKVEQPSEA